MTCFKRKVSACLRERVDVGGGAPGKHHGVIRGRVHLREKNLVHEMHRLIDDTVNLWDTAQSVRVLDLGAIGVGGGDLALAARPAQQLAHARSNETLRILHKTKELKHNTLIKWNKIKL